MLECAEIIVGLCYYWCNINGCCKWDIISFSWTFTKNPVSQWMVLLPPLGMTLIVGLTMNHGCAQRIASICKWCEHTIIEWPCVGFIRLFGLSDSSSYIRLKYKLFGQPFAMRQKSRKSSIHANVVDHTTTAQKQVIKRSYLVL